MQGHMHHEYGRGLDYGYSGDEFSMAEIFPNEGLDLIYGLAPKGGIGPVNTWIALWTANSGTFSSTQCGTSANAIASYSEVSAAGAYARQTISSGSWGTVGTVQGGRGSAAAQVTFPTATAVWGTVNGFLIANSVTNGAGTVWFAANFDDTTAVLINTNDIIKVTPTWVLTG